MYIQEKYRDPSKLKSIGISNKKAKIQHNNTYATGKCLKGKMMFFVMKGI